MVPACSRRAKSDARAILRLQTEPPKPDIVEGITDFARHSRHDIDKTGRQQGGNHLYRSNERQRTGFRWLENDGVSG
jgi:hypothetical protein